MARRFRRLCSSRHGGGRVGLRNELRVALERLEPRHLLAGMNLADLPGSDENMGDEGHSFWVVADRRFAWRDCI